MNERLQKQMDFILEIDKEKNIFRQTHLTNHGRNENDAEHAWHMAIMTYLLKEHANEKIDVAKTMMMCLIHDIVEIDAGDTYAYDTENLKTQRQGRTLPKKEFMQSYQVVKRQSSLLYLMNLKQMKRLKQSLLTQWITSNHSY